MSILIKDMEMPTCFSCQLKSYCSKWAKHDKKWQKKNRDNDCPLVETPASHGRLIDADVMKTKISGNEDTKKTVIKWIDMQETIIEAEVKE